MIGILGEYVGRIYEQVKQRPLYLVGSEVNLDAHGTPDPAQAMAGKSARPS